MRLPARRIQHLTEEINDLNKRVAEVFHLHKFINQGRAEADRSHVSPRRLARMILTRPGNLKAEHHDLLVRLTASCPEMTQLAAVVGSFAKLPTPCAGNADGLSRWIVEARSADLPQLHALARGLGRDRDAMNAALTLPYSNGTTVGVHTKTKRIARQMHTRARFPLLRHSSLLG